MQKNSLLRIEADMSLLKMRPRQEAGAFGQIQIQLIRMIGGRKIDSLMAAVTESGSLGYTCRKSRFLLIAVIGKILILRPLTTHSGRSLLVLSALFIEGLIPRFARASRYLLSPPDTPAMQRLRGQIKLIDEPPT